MSKYDIYGGTIPVEAREIFGSSINNDDNVTTQNFTNVGRQDSSPPRRRTAPSSGRDISDLEDLQSFNEVQRLPPTRNKQQQPSHQQNQNRSLYGNNMGNGNDDELYTNSQRPRSQQRSQYEFKSKNTQHASPNSSYDDYVDNDDGRYDYGDDDISTNSRSPATQQRFTQPLEQTLNSPTFKPGSLFGDSLDLNSPQFGAFSRNRDIEKHLFATKKDEPLYIGLDATFDQDFETADKVYKEALAEGMFDENKLEGDDDIDQWGIKPYNPKLSKQKDTKKKSFFLTEDDVKNVKNPFTKFDGTDFEVDESEMDALYARLQHLSTTPTDPKKSDKLRSEIWDGYKPPKLSDLGLNPADAGYTDREIEEIFGKMQFSEKNIQNKIKNKEPLTPEEEEGYDPPLPEELILDRMAQIEAKKAYRMKRMEEKEWAMKRAYWRLGLRQLHRLYKIMRFSKTFAVPETKFVRLLDNDATSTLMGIIPSDMATYDYNFDPSYRPLMDNEDTDLQNYYSRWLVGLFQPLEFVFSGEMDDLIRMFLSFFFPLPFKYLSDSSILTLFTSAVVHLYI